MDSDETDELTRFIDDFVSLCISGFETRWENVTPAIYDKYIHECVGALLARQVTLTLELAKAPSTWNGHSAPLFLRSMTDLLITLSWILEAPEERCKQYIDYGLGAAKLQLEHYRNLPANKQGEDFREFIELEEAWIKSQQAEWSIVVDVGSWSGKTVREMAQTSKREELYNFAYTPFSAVTHNMWQHVGKYNVTHCQNPMHKFHKIPSIKEAPLDIDYLYRAAKYLTLTFELIDLKLSTSSETQLPIDLFHGGPKEDGSSEI